MKSNIACLFVAIFGFLFLTTRLFLVSAGVITDGEILSFDVDSEENLYVGTLGQISVYNDGTLIRKIAPPTSRAYCFYIEDDQLIIGIVSDGKGGVFDLYGKELSYGNLSYYDIENSSKQNNIVVNGHEYKLSNSFGVLPYKILRDGVEVYHMSSLDYLFNGLPFWLTLICLFVAIIFVVFLKVSDYQAATEHGKNAWKTIYD